MKLHIQHRTTYRYSQPVSFGPHQVMIRPREGHDLHMESSLLEIKPAHYVHWARDVDGNSVAHLDFTEQASELMVYSDLVLEHYNTNPFDFRLDPSAVNFPFVYDNASAPVLFPFIQSLYPDDVAEVRAWVGQFWKLGDQIETIALLQRVNSHIQATFNYQRRDDPGVQTPGETLRTKSGSCRDFAALFLEACRCWGLAARFASGYMLCIGPQMGEASTHAWIEVYLPGAGWKGFDPTNGLVTGSQHVTTAVSRDPRTAAPITGSYLGAHALFLGIDVNVTVTRLDGV